MHEKRCSRLWETNLVLGTNMLAKTHGVRLLAEEILETLSPPYSEDIIEEVFLGIESHSGWMQRYQDLEADLTRHVVNSWMRKYVREIAGME